MDSITKALLYDLLLRFFVYKNKVYKSIKNFYSLTFKNNLEFLCIGDIVLLLDWKSAHDSQRKGISHT